MRKAPVVRGSEFEDSCHVYLPRCYPVNTRIPKLSAGVVVGMLPSCAGPSACQPPRLRKWHKAPTELTYRVLIVPSSDTRKTVLSTA